MFESPYSEPSRAEAMTAPRLREQRRPPSPPDRLTAGRPAGAAVPLLIHMPYPPAGPGRWPPRRASPLCARSPCPPRPRRSRFAALTCPCSSSPGPRWPSRTSLKRRSSSSWTGPGPCRSRCIGRRAISRPPPPWRGGLPAGVGDRHLRSRGPGGAVPGHAPQRRPGEDTEKFLVTIRPANPALVTVPRV